ncbi:MAG: DUF2179 domain-containing protein [Ignavibacteriota bacterium]|jgi:uncharacterized protein YebE (UPF0316 family)|nr:DUF2179 domain-containing protein [Ignavibacteriota bacterium]MBW7841427.1 DUF2179 domain-containing protein [Ignavibacterium sp.]MCO6447877.1 DUF2179 domain-containing protein [Ignavibacterium album]MCZ2267758.1 DUF5698 domain-containing protein [Ignavibacteriales bacterium]MDX9712854.1 DUF5698 domain-containing protein [Ignavibacteriaceae bacterium]
MLESISGALLIMLMRICDVSIGTMRTILVVQGRKYLAGLAGTIEVLIWVFAIRYIFQNLDQLLNLFGYSIGFGLGNILGITLEQKIGLGFAQLNIISRIASDKIAEILRKEKYGVTQLPATGVSGDVSLLVVIVQRKNQKKVISLIESIDSKAFITVQHSLPYRGFIHGVRK